MVRFESADEQAARDLAPVTYLPGAKPGMKRRSPLEGRTLIPVQDSAAVLSLRPPHPHDERDEYDDYDDYDEHDAEAQAGAERERAEKLLLQRLRGRSLSAAEARTVLAETDVGDEEAGKIIARFTELHYIDEARLADQILHSHHERKGLGRTGVEAEMRRRKVLPEVIAQKLEEIPDDDEERATDLALKRVQQLERYDEQTIDRRLTGFLMRKGYPSSVVRAAVKAALASRGRGKSAVRFR